jgi:hypothetical protein
METNKTTWKRTFLGGYSTMVDSVEMFAANRDDGKWYGYCKANSNEYTCCSESRAKVIRDLQIEIDFDKEYYRPQGTSTCLDSSTHKQIIAKFRS